jgi:hypothetical protein
MRLHLLDVGDGACLVGLLAVRGDGSAMVAEVDVGFVADDLLPRDMRTLEAADELLGFSGKHRSCNDFKAARVEGIHAAIVNSACAMVCIMRDKISGYLAIIFY